MAGRETRRFEPVSAGGMRHRTSDQLLNQGDLQPIFAIFRSIDCQTRFLSLDPERSPIMSRPNRIRFLSEQVLGWDCPRSGSARRRMPPLVGTTPQGSLAVDLETALVEEPPVGANALD
jgi:hypothetical protein